jgi:hypothetical protein
MENYVGGVVPVTEVGGSNQNCNGFGGDWSAWIVIILFALIFGWGGNGFGGNGNQALDMSAISNFGRGVASPEDVNTAVNQSALESQIRGITNGISESAFALNNAINGGFADTAQAINSLGYQNQNGLQQLSAQMAECCCNNRMQTMQAQFDNQTAINSLSSQVASGFCDVNNSICNQNYLNAQNTNAIIQASNDNTRAILDKMCQNEIQQLRDQNQAYLNQISQNAQTTSILDALLPVAKPAYLTLSPYQTAFYPFGYSNSGCCGSNFI